MRNKSEASSRAQTFVHLLILASPGVILFAEAVFHGYLFRGTGDAWLNAFPLIKYALEQLGAGRFPLWNPYLASGYNFVADTMNPAFDLTIWPLIPFAGNKTAFFHLIAFRLWLLLCGGGFFVYFGLRAWVRPQAALFAAVTFVLSPAAMWGLSALAQVPVLFYGAALFYLLLTRERRSHLRQFSFTALAVAMMFLAGQFGAAVHVSLAALAVCLLLPAASPPREFLRFSAAGVFGAALASVRLVPMIAAGLGSNRISQDPSVFLIPGAAMGLARSLIPEFLGWNQSGSRAPQALEACNLSYIGIAALGLCGLALSDREFRNRHRGWLWLFGICVLVQLQIPYVYQAAASLISPLMSGGTLYINMIYPFLAAWLTAHAADHLLGGQTLALRPVGAVFAVTVIVLFPFLHYGTSFISGGVASSYIKIAALGFLLWAAFRFSRGYAFAWALAMAAGALVMCLFALAPVFNWWLGNDRFHHTVLFVGNSSAGLAAMAAAAVCLAVARFVPQARKPWVLFGLPALAPALLIVWISETAGGGFDVAEFPVLLPSDVATMAGMVRFIAAGFLLLLFLRYVLQRHWHPRSVLSLLLLFHLAEMTGHGRNYIAAAAMPFKKAYEFFPAKDIPATDTDRFTVDREVLQGMIDNIPVWYGARVAGGYLNFAAKNYVELFREIPQATAQAQFRVQNVPAGLRLGELTASNLHLDANLRPVPVVAKAVARASVIYQVESVPAGTDRVARLLSPEFNVRDQAVVEKAVITPAQFPAQAAALVFDRHGEMEFRTDSAREGLFVLRDSFDPGWSATVNGAPAKILSVNHAFMGVVVPPGPAIVHLSYWPKGLTFGFVTSLTGFVALTVLGLAAVVRRKS